MHGLTIALVVLAGVAIVLLMSIAGTLGDIKKTLTKPDPWDATRDQWLGAAKK